MGVADSDRLGNLTDALPHIIIFPLGYDATLLLPDPHDFGLPISLLQY